MTFRKEIPIAIMLISTSFFLYIFIHFNLLNALPINITELILNQNNYLIQDPATGQFIKGFQNATLINNHLVNDVNNLQLFELLHDAELSFYDIDEQVLGTTKFTAQNTYTRQPYVANGYIGARIPNLGQGFSYDQTDNSSASNGWPLFNKRFSGAYVSGFYGLEPRLPETNFPELYERGYDSVISTFPQWTTLQVIAEVGGRNYTLDPQTIPHLEISNYAQNMSLADGIVSTSYTWLEAVHIKYEVSAHRENPNLGLVSLELNAADNNITLWVIDNIDFKTSERTTLNSINYDGDGISISISPQYVPETSGVVYSSWDFTGETMLQNTSTSISKYATLDMNKFPIKINKFVGIVTTDYDLTISNITLFAKNISLSANTQGYDTSIASHKQEWSRYLTNTSITIPSDALLSLSAKTSLFHLISNTRPSATGLTAALAVGGLSSDSYGGMVFWDTDLWMSVGLLPFAPFNSKSLTYYRQYTHQQAIDNAASYGYSGAAYPWTSGRYGNCTSSGPCIDYEYHINVAVVINAWDVYLSGAGDETYLREVAYPLIRDSANFLSEIATYNETLGKYITHNLTDPDEFANHIDNGAYTNAGISVVMKWAILTSYHLNETLNPQWAKIAGNMYIPESQDGITLEYSNMNSSISVKQADVILISYPLDDAEVDRSHALRDMHWYSEKQSSTGPAMTFPLFSMVSAQLSTSGCSSQSFLKRSAFPYLRAPFGQFSEQSNDNFETDGGTHPAFPFLTAHGGYLQAVFQGLTGYRYSFKTDNTTNQLTRVLKLDPVALPCFEGGIEVKGIKYMNQTLDINITDSVAIIKHNGDCLSDDGSNGENVLISVGERNIASGEYTLESGDELVIPLYFPEKNLVNSISECKRIVNITESVYGDVALSAIDGDNSTNWQPMDLNSAQLLIDLGETKPINSGIVLWGSRPASTLSLSILPETYYDNETTLSQILTVVQFSGDENGSLSWLTSNERQAVNYDDEEAIRKYLKYENATIFTEDEIFVSVLENHTVTINMPFNSDDYNQVKTQLENSTTFDISYFNCSSRFVLVEFQGVLDEDGNTAGASLGEIGLFS